MSVPPSAEPPEFAAAITAVRAVPSGPHLALREIPAPQGLAPHAFALTADVDPDMNIAGPGTGRLVLLYDEQPPATWGGRFRIVAFGQAPIETTVGDNREFADLAWVWLRESLEAHATEYTALSATVTRTYSTGYGLLDEHEDGAEIELRASWTPTDGNLAAHVLAWGEMMLRMSGHPPSREGAVRLRPASRG